MADTLVPLDIPPGIFRNGTPYQARGRWHDGNLVRFFSGTIEPIGGWRTAQTDAGVDIATLSGVPRGAIAWRGLNGNVYVAVATTQKLYVVAAGALYDITPAGFTVGIVDTTTASGSYGAGVYGGGSYGVGSVTSALTDADTWQVDTFGDYLVGVSTSDKKPYIWLGVTANVAVLIDISAATGAPTTTAAIVVTPEKFLMALGTSNQRRVSWASQAAYTGAAGPSVSGSGTLAATAGAGTFSTSQAGVISNGDVVVVGGNSYTVSAFNGTTGCTLSGTPTFGAAAFTYQKSVWAARDFNSAGGYDLASDGRIMTGMRTKNETLIWTDVDVHAARYVGGLAIYRFDQVGDKCGIVSRRAKTVVDTTAFWMGKNSFFMYDGFVRSLNSEVSDYVFNDFNTTQAAKVWAMSVSEFGEVWWFYPSSASTECDRYVVYNYRENHWTIGQLTRTAGVDSGAAQYPIMADSAGKVYEHEILQSRPAVVASQPGIELLTETNEYLVMETGDIHLAAEQTAPYLESGPVQIGEGDLLMSLQRLVPDEKTLGDVRAFVYSALYPTATETLNGPYDLANPTSMRVNARQVRLRLEEVRATDWRVGILRFGVRGSSRR